MLLDTRALHPDFGVEVRNLELRVPLDEALRDALITALETSAVVLLRGQSLDQDQQVALAKQFGPLDKGFKKASRAPSRFKYDELLDISNVNADDRIASPDQQKIIGNIANQLWHSDSSFQHPATAYSMLYAVVLPQSQSVTEYVDCRLAFETLPLEEQAALESLVAKHHALFSRLQLGDINYTEEQRSAIEPAEWPVVKKQKSTGRSSLFIGAHAHEIIGMSVPEGRMLLLDLLEHATHPGKIYRHRWQVGDFLMWDNRTTLHRGRRWDLRQRRELRRTTVLETELTTCLR
jgi:alpha-ketoglutarate-dependent 2,4-dichlorophenoxyacetate dioxygenase